MMSQLKHHKFLRVNCYPPFIGGSHNTTLHSLPVHRNLKCWNKSLISHGYSSGMFILAYSIPWRKKKYI